MSDKARLSVCPNTLWRFLTSVIFKISWNANSSLNYLHWTKYNNCFATTNTRALYCKPKKMHVSIYQEESHNILRSVSLNVTIDRCYRTKRPLPSTNYQPSAQTWSHCISSYNDWHSDTKLTNKIENENEQKSTIVSE